MTAMDRLLSVLPEAHRVRENQYRARCPVHQGLSITAVEDGVLIHCHGGCDYKSILTALNLQSAAELFNLAKAQVDTVKALAITGLSKWCERRLLGICSSLRNVEQEIGTISSELAEYEIGDAPPNAPRREQLWSQLKNTYERRAAFEHEFDVLNGRDEQAKLEIWRSHGAGRP
jgi:hypothetical protein